MKNSYVLKTIYILTVLVIIISGCFFSRSKGLVLKGNDNGIYVTELLSSGSDDNVIIEFSVILFVPVIILLLFRITKSLGLIVYIIANIVSMVQILLLFFIEAGSIINTIIYDYNLALCMWIIFFALFIFLTQYLYFSIFLKSINCLKRTDKIGGK